MTTGKNISADHWRSRLRKHGIKLRYILPGRQQQNAHVGRYKRPVRTDWLSQYSFESIADAQDAATKWLWVSNNERPNMRLSGITPKQKLRMAF